MIYVGICRDKLSIIYCRTATAISTDGLEMLFRLVELGELEQNVVLSKCSYYSAASGCSREQKGMI